MVDDRRLVKLFLDIANKLIDNGFTVSYKNHPNPNSVLILPGNFPGLEVDSFMPVELIDQEYIAVIGCASTALVNFRGRAISIMELADMSPADIESRKIHLLSLPGGEDIHFVSTLDELVLSINSIRVQRGLE